MLVRFLAFLAATIGAPLAHGADLQRQASQLTVRHWNKTDGLPAEMIWSVHQSASGYLWLATDTGLARFDGQSFKTYSSATHDVFKSNDISEVAEGPDGTIWVASVGGGVLRMRGEDITRFDRTNGLASDAVYSILVARNGDVWAGTASGVCRLKDSTFHCWTEDDGLVGGRIVRMAEDPQQRMWFASIATGVSVLDGDTLRSFSEDNGFADGGTTVLVAHPDHNMLIGTLAGRYFRADPQSISQLESITLSPDMKPFNGMRDREGNTIITMLGGIWQVEPHTRRLDDPNNEIGYVTDLFEDRDGQLWAASSTGLYQYRAGAFTPFGKSEGVANQTFVVASALDSSVWAGTEASGAFNVYATGEVNQYTTANGLPSNAVASLMVDADGTVWIGTFGGGLAVMRDKAIVRVIGKDDGLVGNQVGAIYRDRSGQLWVGTNAGLNRLSGYDVTATLTENEGLLNNRVRDVREDGAGRLLVSGDNGLTIVAPDSLKILDRLDGSKGLSNTTISTTYVDDRGVIWIGGRSGGLMRMDGNELFQFNADHNVSQTSVMTIQTDGANHLWLGGRDGITRILRSELDAVAAGERERVTATTFSGTDGLRSTRVSGGYQSASAMTGDGRLWFATTGGLAAIEPAKLNTSAAPLPIAIEAVRADGITVPRSSTAEYRIPAGTQSVQIDYAVPSLNAAESLRFHYRLGKAPWQDAEQRRTAFFTSLPPRGHTFEVAVRLDGQLFSGKPEQKDAITVFVEPHWHQTHIARAAALWAVCLALWAGYRFSLRYYRRRQRHLEQLVDERTAALREALSEVRAMSRTDPLTGIANRRCLEERVKEAWAAAIRYQHAVTIMMVDIDHFKRYNDSAGHQEGDRCLTLVAQALQKSVRTEDFVARYGGEEFSVLMMGGPVDAMRRVAERLKDSVRELNLAHPGLPDGAVVTISAGFATAQPVAGDNVDSLMRCADEALYLAKEQGRDRIVYVEHEPTGSAIAMNSAAR